MAKKASPVKKSTAKPTKKGKSKSGSNYTLLAILLLVIFIAGVLTFYYIGERTSKRHQAKHEHSQHITPDAPSTEKEKSTENPTTVNNPRPKPSADAPITEAPTRNSKIEVSPNVDEYYYTSSFDFSWPAYSNTSKIVEYETFALQYDDRNKQPKWVAYKITKEQIKSIVKNNKLNLALDPELKWETANINDYKNAEFLPIPLASIEDIGYSMQSSMQAQFMSNISPQYPQFNQGIWRSFESRVRNWTSKYDRLYIVTGPLFDDKVKVFGKNKIAIPVAFFKVVLGISKNGAIAIGFIIPHSISIAEPDFMEYAATIDDIESISGLDFFPQIPDILERKLENTVNKSNWD